MTARELIDRDPLGPTARRQVADRPSHLLANLVLLLAGMALVVLMVVLGVLGR
jgi:hypothetical protein